MFLHMVMIEAKQNAHTDTLNVYTEIDASDEDGSYGHLTQNSLNFTFMILEMNILGVKLFKVKLTPVIQKQKVILTFMNI
ncbi:hypothetical protein KUTeg_017268 [Tegillarca granosa]|uniref:Uncharacterized protein n=1 Tax=Tegillarca granosa TaxID=220873 RepID=A0ABQ9EJ10_TEGGR|nr:hypothetical protein KUTeg_017268 [Tegillarca granosa]